MWESGKLLGEPVMVDMVLPGVGVYYPGLSLLEGDVSRLRHLTVEQSFKCLRIHVHKPEDLAEVLSQDIVRKVEQLSIEYHCRFSMNNLTRALLGSAFDCLKRLDIQNPVKPWDTRVLQSLCRQVSGASIHTAGHTLAPLGVSSDDEVVVDETSWFRHRGDTVSTFASQLLWTEGDIVARKPRRLILDCESQWHAPTLLVSGQGSCVEDVALHNVEVDPVVFMTFLRTLKLPKLRRFVLTLAEDRVLYGSLERQFWQAFSRWPHLKGVIATFNQLSKL